MLVAFPGDLLGGRDHALGALGLAAHPDDDQPAGVGAGVALDHAGDDVAFAGRELAVGLLVLRVAQPLQHHLTCRRRGDAAETLRGVVPLADDVAVFVGFARDDLDLTGLAVDLDAGVGLVPLGVPVGGEQGGLDGLEQLADGHSSVDLDRVQRSHVDVHVPASSTTDPGKFELAWIWGRKLHLDNRFDDAAERNVTDLPVTTVRADHHVQNPVVGGAEPAGDRRAVGQRQVGLASAGAAEMLLAGQRPVDARRANLQHVTGGAGSSVIQVIEQCRRSPGQRRDGVQVQRIVAVGDHGDAGRTGLTVNDHVLDLIAGTRELVIE